MTIFTDGSQRACPKNFFFGWKSDAAGGNRVMSALHFDYKKFSNKAGLGGWIASESWNFT